MGVAGAAAAPREDDGDDEAAAPADPPTIRIDIDQSCWLNSSSCIVLVLVSLLFAVASVLLLVVSPLAAAADGSAGIDEASSATAGALFVESSIAVLSMPSYEVLMNTG